ncbi:MAG: NAD(P)/FAD-dependent oxidoreductase [Firmicutes bacterium]|nr:NAD(P)/FAD-dependent oxidoreductase [Bacillota bacterium]
MTKAPELYSADVAIIGGGIVGTAVLYELSQYRLRLALIEKNAEVGWGATKANSGIVHGGFHDDPNTWKGKLCIRGNQKFPELAKKLDVGFRQNGILMVAFSEEDLPVLEQHLERGKLNQVPGIRIISREEALALEPNLSEDVIAALYAPEGGIVNPFEMAIAFSEVAQANGAALFTDTTVIGLEDESDRIRIVTDKGVIYARYVINAAGLYADEVARFVGDTSFTITPRKGEEYLMDKRVGDLVHRTIFPTPSPKSKGILVIPTAEGNLMIGPTALELPDKEALDTTASGFEEIVTSVRRIVPRINSRDIITSFVGLRAASDRGDFILEPSSKTPRLIHAAGIESPGLTAAPAIAEVLTELLVEAGLELEENPEAVDSRRPFPRFHAMDNEERAKLIASDPSFGHIICRCETITEGEIVEAIKRGARTVDGIKFRTRAGMGRCQGGFCQPLVIAILARELGVDPTEITKRGPGSEILLEPVRKGLASDDNVSSQKEELV